MGLKAGLAGMLFCAAAANASVNSDLERIASTIAAMPEVASTQLCITPNATKAIVHFRQGHVWGPEVFWYVITNGDEMEKREAYEIADQFYSSVNDVQKDLYHIIERLAPLELYTEAIVQGETVTKESAVLIKYSWLTMLQDSGLLHDNEQAKKYIALKYLEAGSTKKEDAAQRLLAFDQVPIESFDYVTGAQFNLVIDGKIIIKAFEDARLFSIMNQSKDYEVDNREDYFIDQINEDQISYVLLGGAHAFAGPRSCPAGDFSTRISSADNIAGKPISLLEVTPKGYAKIEAAFPLTQRLTDLQKTIIDRDDARESSLQK